MLDRCSGGIELIFNGTNLDVVQNPMLVISDPQYLEVSNVNMILDLACIRLPFHAFQYYLFVKHTH